MTTRRTGLIIKPKETLGGQGRERSVTVTRKCRERRKNGEGRNKVGRHQVPTELFMAEGLKTNDQKKIWSAMGECRERLQLHNQRVNKKDVV